MLVSVYTIGRLVQPLTKTDKSLFLDADSLAEFRRIMSPGDYTFIQILGHAPTDIEAMKVTMTSEGNLMLERAQGGTLHTFFPVGSCVDSRECRLWTEALLCEMDLIT